MAANYAEYLDSIRNVDVSGDLEYALAVVWLHPEILPVCLISTGGCGLPVIRVPERITNRYGRSVPVVAISREAFPGNEIVTDIILPSTVERLPAGAFSGCKNLKNITIPKNIRTIKEKTFEGCGSLENVYYEGTPEEWDAIEIIHEKREIDFGTNIPGTPVREIRSERRMNIPGNEALLSANIHFRCELERSGKPGSFQIKAGGKDITDAFRTTRD
ncbi:MAG: leucine-rich repeat domain-containing protein [Clostridia bacterium]|nr:leucine-rich repeat domain-containing protein [Clostridia bacterium]